MPDNDESKVHLSKNPSDKHDMLPNDPFRRNTKWSRIKECVIIGFCIVLVIIGTVLAIRTGNQWWFALPLGPFSIIVAGIYAKKEEPK